MREVEPLLRIIDELRYAMRKAADDLDFAGLEPYGIDPRLDVRICQVQRRLRAKAAAYQPGDWQRGADDAREPSALNG